MLIKSLKLTNFLSFGTDSEHIELRPLNVLVGPNGSGKSNFIEAIGLLRAAPRQLATPIGEGGGVIEWIWKGHGRSSGQERDPGMTEYGGGSADGSGFGDGTGEGGPRAATLEAILAFRPNKGENLRHRISFAAVGQRFEVLDERIENERPAPGKKKPFLYFGYERGRPMLNVKEDKGKRLLQRHHLHPERSILAQIKDPERYPELSFVSNAYEDIGLYREWHFGRGSPIRMPQKTDLPMDHLLEDASNLALVLNRYRLDSAAKRPLIEAMQEVFEGAEDFMVKLDQSTAQIVLEDAKGWPTPAVRLSDGTLRWLSLLAVLLDPKPPYLVCIEEPELGLHPDLIPTLARLLKEASTRMQLIITTHSEVLVDALSKSPEDVVVCEREGGATTMQRLDKEKLAHWLTSYKLGQLWSKGVIGGNRW